MQHTPNASHDRSVASNPPAAAQPRHGSARNRELGALGESLAAEYLQRQGYQILTQNWRCGRLGELDLVASDGDTIVAVEVKTRTGTGYGHPLEAITTAKSRRVRSLLFEWLRESGAHAPRVRIDAIGIVLSQHDAPRIHHLQGIV